MLRIARNTALGVFALTLAACRPDSRVGPLAAVADSILPAAEPQVCDSVPRRGTAPLPNDRIRCTSRAAPQRIVESTPAGVVTEVEARSVTGDSAAFERQLSALTASYGPPERACGAAHWQTSTLDITLWPGRAHFLLRRQGEMDFNCP